MKRIPALAAALICCIPLFSQPIGPSEVQVRGQLIDIRTVSKKETFFPQCDASNFTPELIAALGNGTKYAVSIADYAGPEQLRCGRSARCRVALAFDGVMPKPWTDTGESFDVFGLSYRIFENRKVKTGEWIDIPRPEGCTGSSVVFGDELTVDGTPDFGTVICKVSVLRKKSAYNQTFTILPDGNYLAACTMGHPKGPRMFISKDKGATWQEYGNYDVSKNYVGNYHNLFVHRGNVYFMGVGPDREGLRICRSEDGGQNWTSPVDAHSGIILEGQYHTAPVPMLVSGGRIWRACETYPDKMPFMLSAPEDADLLEASNWTRTNIVGPASKLVDGRKMTGSMIEGNAVETPSGEVVNLIRTNSTRTSNYATILHVSGIDSLYFNPASDWVRMPGGGKKFTVRKDPVGGMYWALTNPDEEDEEYNHSGLGYKVGISHSLMRNKLVLVCSADLVNWFECKTVLYDPDPFFHGFQYADWDFDGDDIVGVVRVGAPESRGLPVRQHDSNMMTFVRISGFRNLAL